MVKIEIGSHIIINGCKQGIVRVLLKNYDDRWIIYYESVKVGFNNETENHGFFVESDEDFKVIDKVVDGED